MSAVYADTSALLPIFDRRDGDWARIEPVLARLRDADAPLVTTSYVLVEAGALIQRRVGPEAFRAFGELADVAFEVIWVDEVLHRAAWAATEREGARGPSLVDHVGFLVMRDLGIDTALALDGHFRTQGFRTLPDTR